MTDSQPMKRYIWNKAMNCLSGHPNGDVVRAEDALAIIDAQQAVMREAAGRLHEYRIHCIGRGWHKLASDLAELIMALDGERKGEDDV